jgi:hypothetical protein
MEVLAALIFFGLLGWCWLTDQTPGNPPDGV